MPHALCASRKAADTKLGTTRGGGGGEREAQIKKTIFMFIMGEATMTITTDTRVNIRSTQLY